jgi:hypothetical protein
MKTPMPSDFVVDVTDTRVNVVFKPNGNPYTFGRLVDPDDIAHYGPVSHAMDTYSRVGAEGEYAGHEVAAMAHALAIEAVSAAASE